MGMQSSNNGTVEVKFNADQTAALATITPPGPGGDSVTVTEVRDHLKQLGVLYGIRDRAIRNAIHYAEDTDMIAANVVVALGALPEDGTNAHIQYRMPVDLLSQPPPKHPSGLPMPNWFALNPQKMVKAGQELASIVPAQPGVPGRTLTWPIQSIAPNPGLPANVSAGLNVRLVEATSLVAMSDGYAWLSGNTVNVQPLEMIESDMKGEYTSSLGLVVRGNAIKAEIRTDGFVAIEGAAVACRIRANEDIIISYAENCEFATPGSVYVLKGLKNCQVIARGRVQAISGSLLAGGNLRAYEGLEVDELGSEDSAETEVYTGRDHFTDLRNREIQAELSDCEENIAKITLALKPFTGHTSIASLGERKRSSLHQLQLQKRTLDWRINQLHTERRHLSFLRHEIGPGIITASGAVRPGVNIKIGNAAFRVETALNKVRFLQTPDGSAVDVQSLLESAA